MSSLFPIDSRQDEQETPLAERHAPMGAELALAWSDLPKLGREEADAFAADIQEARRKLSPLDCLRQWIAEPSMGRSIPTAGLTEQIQF